MKKSTFRCMSAAALCVMLIFSGCTRTLPPSSDTPISTTPSNTETAPPTTTTTTSAPTTVTRYALTAPSAPSKANGKVLINAPLIHQYPEYPTGCEAVAAVMALQYRGINTSVANFIDNYLPCDTSFVWRDGKLYGPNPYEYFLGNPRTNNSYGCMSPVIKKALIRLLGNDKQVVDATGQELSALCSTYIDKGHPVMVWVSIKMIAVTDGSTWTMPNGNTYTWPNNEHCMLLVGYDNNKYYFNDPYTGRLVSYSRSLSEQRYERLGKQALIIQ